MTCPSCGTLITESDRFCSSCGHALGRSSDERRVVTVLFADLVGFTTLSESRDPEQVKELVDACFSALVRDVSSFGGQVDKIVGDALLVLFGAPVAHEDDAERAVRAALRMLDTVSAYRVDADAPVQLRIGVNTGEVLVGALRAGGDYTAMGDVVNTAQRLQVAADPGSVVVGPATYAATRESIAYRSLGAVDVKGRDEAVEAWTAIEPLLPPGHRPRRPQTPFVGRESELGVLANAVGAAVERRRAHLLLLIGEAGVGKSRLAERAAADAGHRHGAWVFEGRCVPYGEANIWWPIAEALREACRIEPDHSLTEALPVCTDAVATVTGRSPEDPDVVRIVTGLLYLMGYEVSLREIEPQRAREEATRAVIAFIQAATATRAVVLVLSDLHWADPLVLELVAALVDRLAQHPFVLLATARPAVTEQWNVPTGRHNSMVVNLDPLERAAAVTLLDALADRDLTDEVRDALLDRSGGNPFFLEELVALVGDSELHDAAAFGSAPLADLPDTLRGLVSARLDGLSAAERGSLEDAAVWGRSGPTMALEIMAEEMRETPDLTDVLAGLDDKEILEVRGTHWAFRSDLVREVAYGTLTKADRARRHYGIATYLAHTKPSLDDADARLVDMVGFHYGAAAELLIDLGRIPGIPESVRTDALSWLEEAARRAEVNQALPVAERLYSQALRIVGTDGGIRRAHLLLGRAGVEATQRLTETARADVEEAHTIALGAEDEAVLARSLLVRGQVERDEGDTAVSVATLTDAVARFENVGDEKGAAHAMREIGMAQIFLGHHREAERAIRRALEASKRLGDRRGVAWALQHLAWISFIEGRTDEAEDRLLRSAERFAELGDVGGLGWATGLLAFVRFTQGDLASADELGEQVLVETRVRGDRWGEGMMLLLGSGVRLWSGRTSEAVDYARAGHALFHAIGDLYGQAQTLAALGRSLVAAGRVGEGLATLEAGWSEQQSQQDGSTSDDPPVVLSALVGSAVVIGEPERALDALAGRVDFDHLLPGTFVEVAIGRGLALLQSGRVEEAIAELTPAARGTEDVAPSAYAQSVLALADAVAGDPRGVEEMSSAVLSAERASYLDRLLAALAVMLSAVGAGESTPPPPWSAAIAEIDATGDELAKAIVALASAAAATALGDPESPMRRDEAETRLTRLGIEAEGWRRVFGLALDAAPAPV